MKGIQRILAVCLCFCMVFTAVPVSAVADAVEEYMPDSSSAAVSEQQDASEASDEGMASEGQDASQQTTEETTASSEASEQQASNDPSTSLEDGTGETSEDVNASQPEVETPQTDVATALEGTPISTPQELQAMNNNLSGTYYLANDIDMTGFAFTPIGSGDTPFTGAFDGNGYEVQNLTIDNSTSDYQGLFGTIGTDGKVMNVGVSGSITAKSYVGGVAGYNRGTITNCYNAGNVSGNEHVGGVAGYNDQGTITSCYNTGNAGGSNYVGGVAGYNYKGTITSCYNTGSVTRNSTVSIYVYLGGVAGYNKGTITSCYNTGDVSGSGYLGGVAGYNDSGEILNCYNIGEVTGSDYYIGGVAGYNTQGTITSCYNTGDVSGNDYVGGVAGKNYSGEILNCYSIGEVIGVDYYIGGVAGYNKGIITSCYNTGSVTGNSTSSKYDYVGGVAGCNYGTITNCYYCKDIATGVNGAIEGSDTESCKGLTVEQMTGANALENMTFTSEAGTWVTLDNETEADENREIDYYFPQLSTFVSDPANPQPEEMPSKTGYQMDDGRIIFPILIKNAKQLQAINNNLSGAYVLVNNIDMTGFTFTPIGSNSSPFTGVFYGNGYEVQNLKIDNSTGDYQGLFGTVGTDGKVMNVGVTGSIKGGYRVGSVAAYNAGTITNCYSTVAVTGTSFVGGVVGDNAGTITNCYNTGSVTSNNTSGWSSFVGGVAGSNLGKISNCYNTGSVTSNNTSGSSSSVGGIAGWNYEETISNCYNTGSIVSNNTSSCSSCVGGVVGENQNGVILNCYNIGEVTGSDDAGSVAGYSEGTITNCYYCTDIATGVKGAINGSDTETCKGLTLDQITGANALDNMSFSSDAGTWVTLANETKADENNIIDYYLPQLSVFVSDPANPQPEEMSKITCYQLSDGTLIPNPILITNAEQLQAINNNLSGGYILANNIDMTGFVFTPIGSVDIPFTGIFEGNGYEVQNLTIDNSTGDYQGLFGYVGTDGKVMNVGVTGSIKANNYVGGVAGCNHGTITNCYNTGSVTGNSNYIGGVAGYNSQGTLSNCYNTGSVTSNNRSSGRSYVGGVAGCNYGTTTNCYNAGNISGKEDYVGGVAGTNQGTITNCYNTGNISGKEDYVGGVAGTNQGTITNCYNTGNVSGSRYVSGVAGYNSSGEIRNCYNIGEVTGSDSAGGVVGYNYIGMVANCYNTGNVSGNNYIGGVAGYNKGTITNCYNTGSITGYNSSIGGVAGYNEGMISNCYNTGSITGDSSCIGGVAGYNNDKGMISNCYYCKDIATGVNGAIEGSDTETCKGLTVDRMTGANALDNMSFNSDAGTWVTLANETKADENNIIDYYLPQLSVFVSDPANPQPEEMPTIACYQSSDGTLILKPTLITNAEQLQAMNNNLSDVYVLVNNIDMTDFAFTPIGSKDTPFTGIFEGNGYEVQNLTIDNSESDYQGLFGYIGTDGKVMNVGVTGSITANDYVGGIVGYNKGKITGCYSTATIIGHERVGGVAGKNYTATITNCYNTGSITCKDYIGGVAGDNYRGTITNCYNTGSITGKGYIGGVAGDNYTGTITNCYNTGSVTGYCGVAGYNSKGKISNCYYCKDIATSVRKATEDGYIENCKGLTLDQMTGANALENMTFTSEAGTWVTLANETKLDENNIIDYYLPQLSVFVSDPANPQPEEMPTISCYQSSDGTLVLNVTLITNAEQLQDINNDLSGAYILANDIDMTDFAFTPIGSKDTPFTGIFEGNGYEVQNLTINHSGSDYQGLFGTIGTDGKVMNVGVSGSIKGFLYVGGVASSNYGTITNCYNAGNISGKEDYVGGVAGTNHGTITNCYNTGSVIGGSWIGGVAGNNEKGTITSCYNTGSVTGDGVYVGGVAGASYSGEILNCYNTGSITGNNDHIGGVAGYNDKGTVTNCYNIGEVTGSNNYVGGVAGNNYGTITNCYNTGNVSGKGYVGGVAGHNYGTLTNCYNTGGVIEGSSLGGVVGENMGTISNCYNTGNVSGSAYVGGVVGEQYSGEILNCYSTGNVSGSRYVGGVASYVNKGTISNCYNTGNISGSEDIGGVAGYDDKGTISNCYYCTNTSGNVKGAINGSDTETCKGLTFDRMTGANALDNMVFTSDAGTWVTLANETKADENNIIDYYLPQLSVFVSDPANPQPEEMSKITCYQLSDGTLIPNPILITNAEQLQAINNNLSGGYILANNIDMTGFVFTPIGSVDIPFTGIFEGNGYELQNLTIDNSESDYQGLFGYIETGGKVMNVGVSGSIKGDYRVGSVAAYNAGTITNCYSTVAVTGTTPVGGVAGYNAGTITNCYNTGSVTSKSANRRSSFYIGGVAGTNHGTISNCYNTGSVIKNNIGSVYIGGVAGYNADYTKGTISNCYNTGSVISNNIGSVYIGGVVGDNDATITNCYNTGSVTKNGDSFYSIYVGGVVGDNNATITNCYNIGSVTENGDSFYTYVGGIAGDNDKTISNCYNTGSITGDNDYIGGVAGKNDKTITYCYNTGSVITNSDYDSDIGGIAGYNEGAIGNCYNTGSVITNSDDDSYIGGVAGHNKGTIGNCYNTGNVIGTKFYIGGVVGYNQKTVTNCYYCKDSARKAKGAINGIDTETCKGLTLDQMTGANALENMVFTSDAGTWVTLANETKADENNIIDCYSPQLSVFVSDPANPQPEEMPMITRYQSSDGTLIPNPTFITNAEQLQAMNNNLNGNYVLGNNIDMTGFAFTPIGSADTSFNGIFDGNGYEVQNLTIDNSTGDYQGLFGYIGICGEVMNVGVSGSIKADYRVGSVAAYNAGTITNCYSTVAVTGTSPVGGVVGYNKGNITNCYNTENVSGSEYVGGVAGTNHGTITNCYNTGDVIGDQYVGSVAGYSNSQETISNCYYCTDTSKSVKGAIEGRDTESCKGLTVEQMTGANALDNMAFTSDAGTWVTLANETQADENREIDYYFPQLSTFVSDPANPQPEEMPTITLHLSI